MGFWDVFKPIARIGSDILTGGGAEAFWQPEGMIEGAVRGGGGGGGGGNSATDLAQVLGKASQNAAAGRMQEGQYLNNRDAIKARLYEAQQDAAKTAIGLPGQGASEAVRGSLLKNLQDQGVEVPAGSQLAGHVLNFTGGIRPSLLEPGARQAGADLITHGQKLIADPNSFLPKSPEMSAIPEEGFWSKLAGIGGTAAGIGGAIGPYLGKGRGQQSGPDNTYGDFPTLGTPSAGAGQGDYEDPYDKFMREQEEDDVRRGRNQGSDVGE